PDEVRPAGVAAPGRPEEPPASGGVFGSGDKGPVETVTGELEKEKSAEELAREARMAEIDAANSQKLARVVVLEDEGTDYKNESLQRNIKARIARPDAGFFPDVDLYQAGRTERDRTVRPMDQRAAVPPESVADVMAAVEETSTIPFDGMSEQDWGIRANELYKLADELWFVDRAELREPLFLLYAQMGRAAENSNQGAPPFFENVDGRPVNYFWYLAGALAYKDPALLSKLTTEDLYQSIAYYKDQLDSGAFRQMTLSFDLDSEFDPKEFAGEYEVYINGIAETVKNPNGLHEVPLGRADIFLKRADGYSMSDHYERTVIPERFDFVRQNARKRMGIDFIEQLMEHPSDCVPTLSGDIVNYLAIYAKLHPDSEIYIAVPYGGSTAPGRIFLWRWMRPQAALQLVLDNTGGFPVRFAAIIGAGLAFNSGDLAYPTDEQLQGAVSTPPAPGEEVPVGQTVDDFLPKPTFNPEGAPIFYQLRGHYNRLIVGAGMQYKVVMGDQPYKDLYQVETDEGHVAVQYVGGTASRHAGTTPTGSTSGTPTGSSTSTNGSTPATPPDGQIEQVALRERTLQRLVYAMVGVMLGRDAGVGFGPRGYLRLGWYNAPHAVDMTGHVGLTSRIGSKKDDARIGRVRALVDADFFGGALLPFRDSLFLRDSGFLAVGSPMVTFGLTVGAGLTF
ncbi:MAG: hypothetical protein ABMB14_27985, partial [Myxococcota bacterium]